MPSSRRPSTTSRRSTSTAATQLTLSGEFQFPLQAVLLYGSDLVAFSIFETTIRYIGGFLSAYELSGYKYPILVQKAKQIGDKLVHGFDDGVRRYLLNLSFVLIRFA